MQTSLQGGYPEETSTEVTLDAMEMRVIRSPCTQHIVWECIGSFAPFSTTPAEIGQFLGDHYNNMTDIQAYADTDWHAASTRGNCELRTESYSGGVIHQHVLTDLGFLRLYNSAQADPARPYYCSGVQIPLQENGNMWRVTDNPFLTFGDMYLMWRLAAEFFSNYTTGWRYQLTAMNPSKIMRQVVKCISGHQNSDAPSTNLNVLVNTSGVSVDDYRPNAYTRINHVRNLWVTNYYDRTVDTDRRPANVNVAVGVQIGFGGFSIKPIIGFEFEGQIFNINDIGLTPNLPEIKALQAIQPERNAYTGFDRMWQVATFLSSSGDYWESELKLKSMTIIPGSLRLNDDIDFSIIRPLIEKSGAVPEISGVDSSNIKATLVNINRVGNSREMKLTFRLLYQPDNSSR